MKKKKTVYLVLVFVLLLSMFNLAGTSSAERAVPQLAPWDKPLANVKTLRAGNPSEAGMLQEPLDSMDTMINGHIRAGMMPGAVALVARSGRIVKHQAYGYAARYKDANAEMENPISMKEDTIFDIASISKVFTSTAAMILYERNAFKLDDPVSRYIPEFAQNGKEHVTIKQLLTHTSGFQAGLPLYKESGSREDKLQRVFREPLTNKAGTVYLYSDLNMITLGALIERVTGKREDEFVKKEITGPLGMADTMYNPPSSLKNRIAATEFQANIGRGLVWGSVHDENAWSMDGVAGHAGVFSTAKDLTVLAQVYLNEGMDGQKRLLKRDTVRLMMKDYNQDFKGDDHGLGWELAQGWYMDSLADSQTLGHTGYTGTSIVVSPKNRMTAILLTNRVHPGRNTPSLNPVRRAFAQAAGDAIPVVVPGKKDAMFAGYGNLADHTLTARVHLEAPARLTFKTWYRIEEDADYGYLEISQDGQQWTEIQQPYTGNSGGWINQKALLPAGTEYVRFRYSMDETTNGRGWYISQPRLEGKKAKDLEWEKDGWVQRDY
ncbi:serine hydrolase [Bacillus testis]|uniref:serine hydrolase n=1 Tax=Bacillus testis TaxID=1622072 RepID=UPI00067E8890|nr:serine hydrolase [Bacillus testis]